MPRDWAADIEVAARRAFAPADSHTAEGWGAVRSDVLCLLDDYLAACAEDFPPDLPPWASALAASLLRRYHGNSYTQVHAAKHEGRAIIASLAPPAVVE